MNEVSEPDGGRRRTYSLYGHRVQTNFPLYTVRNSAAPCLNLQISITKNRNAPQNADAVVGEEVYRLPCDCIDHQGSLASFVRIEDDVIHIWHDRVGLIDISINTGRIDIYQDPAVTDLVVENFVFGFGTCLLMPRLGHLPLHASGVAFGSSAVAFLGSGGQGKSTLANALMQRGAQFLTDDLLVLHEHGGEIYTAPGPTTARLWAAGAREVLGITRPLPKLPNSDKRILILGSGTRPPVQHARLRRLYLLARHRGPVSSAAPIGIERLSASEAIAAVLAQVPRITCIGAAEAAKHLRLVAAVLRQARVAVLSYPEGPEHHDRIAAQLREDLER